VTALALPDDAALLKAMGQGQLEAIVDEYDRAVAMAVPDVQVEVGRREADVAGARARADIALGAGDTEAAAEADREAEAHAGELARLTVADAARREWTEAHAGQATQAQAAERELHSRGLEARIPVTDAEVAQASARERETPVIDPAEAARWRAEQAAELKTYREAEAEKMARLYPVTDAEIAKYGAGAQPEPEAQAEREPQAEPGAQATAEAGPEPGPEPEVAGIGQERADALAGVREEIGVVSAKADELAERDAERDAERRAEMDQAGINEPVVHEPQAEPELESAWQPGSVQGYREPDAAADAEPEMEIG
jgi:hypothetical protein